MFHKQVSKPASRLAKIIAVPAIAAIMLLPSGGQSAASPCGSNQAFAEANGCAVVDQNKPERRPARVPANVC